MNVEIGESKDAIEAIRAREQAATRGPWIVDHDFDDCSPDGTPDQWPYRICTRTLETIVDFTGGSEVSEENAQFMAHAREDIPKLLAEIDRLRAAGEGRG